VQHDAAQAVGQVRALMFIERFSSDIEDRLDQWQSSPSAAGGHASAP
jgi:hypothetical protein